MADEYDINSSSFPLNDSDSTVLALDPSLPAFDFELPDTHSDSFSLPHVCAYGVQDEHVAPVIHTKPCVASSVVSVDAPCPDLLGLRLDKRDFHDGDLLCPGVFGDPCQALGSSRPEGGSGFSTSCTGQLGAV
jgi:hypothetical protein